MGYAIATMLHQIWCHTVAFLQRSAKDRVGSKNQLLEKLQGIGDYLGHAMKSTVDKHDPNLFMNIRYDRRYLLICGFSCAFSQRK